MGGNNEIRCYTCRHRYYTDAHGFNPYCENNCGDGDCYKAYEPDDGEAAADDSD